MLFRLLSHCLPFFREKDLRPSWRSRKTVPTDILIAPNVSEDGISLLPEMIKSNNADQITVTIALLHSWISISESTSTPKNRDFREKNTADALFSKSEILDSGIDVIPLFS